MAGRRDPEAEARSQGLANITRPARRTRLQNTLTHVLSSSLFPSTTTTLSATPSHCHCPRHASSSLSAYIQQHHERPNHAFQEGSSMTLSPPRFLASANSSTQAASALENFKMESPAKPGVQVEANKENMERYESDEIAVPIKGIPMSDEPEKEEAPAVAPGIKEEEAVEPILQENPQRFVLFPIKYHEVCCRRKTRALTRKVVARQD